MITANLENLFTHRVGDSGITQAIEHKFTQSRIVVGEAVAKDLRDGNYGFINALSLTTSQITTYISKNPWIKTLVVIGIGGSDLGGRAIRQALAKETKSQKPNIDVIFHGDSPDPHDIEWLKDRIKYSSTVFNIVSKSGGTMETMLQYAYLKELMMKKNPKDWRKHFVFTTDANEGVLEEESKKYKIKTFAIPEDVGGRFSVLTPVGLLPAAAMGLDIKQMLAGAACAVDNFLEHPVNSLPMLIAWGQYLLHEQGIKAAVLMPYSSRLGEFGRWYRQLWAESLGKEGLGVLPIQARGPADQHSQLQYYTEGESLSSFWFVRIEDHEIKHSLKKTDIESLEYLVGKDFGEILNIEQQATAESITKAGKPNATISIDKLDEFALAELFVVFELAVVILAEFFGVNAFDQPGVEDSKNLMYGLLGREGY